MKNNDTPDWIKEALDEYEKGRSKLVWLECLAIALVFGMVNYLIAIYGS